MTNIDAVNGLFTAINFDRFAEIEARHMPDATFWSFRGPTLHDSISIADWHREFLRDYADCNYAELEYVEQGSTIGVRATIEAKGYDWRPFAQRVVEVLDVEDGLISERRLYGMLRDIELVKPATAAMTAAAGFNGGSVAETKAAVEGFYSNLVAGKADEAQAFLADKGALVDSVFGIASGSKNVLDLLAAMPKPLFGAWRPTRVIAGPREALVEMAIDPLRPRRADWVRIIDGKIGVIESYWMLREIGMNPYVNYSRDRHKRQVILPV